MNRLLNRYRLSEGPLSRAGFVKSVAIMMLSTLAITCVIIWPSRLLLSQSIAGTIITLAANAWVLALIIGARALARRRLLALRGNPAEADIFLVVTVMAVLLYHLGVVDQEVALGMQFAQFIGLLRREPGEPIIA